MIAILATLAVLAYNGVQSKAVAAQHSADMTQLDKSIRLARQNTDQTLKQITGSGCSLCRCQSTADNPNAVEPRELPSTHHCWTRYRTAISRIAAASSTNLDAFMDGDARGNPYAIDENEGENALTDCRTDNIRYFTGNGIGTTGARSIPLYSSPCI